MFLPFFRFEIVRVDQGVVCNVHHTSARVAENLTKGHQLFDHTWVVIAKQIAEHLFGGEQKLLV